MDMSNMSEGAVTKNLTYMNMKENLCATLVEV